ncbi:MAG: hypothetical protein V1926_00490 [Candidatus Peregrinibacteria bacterium]
MRAHVLFLTGLLCCLTGGSSTVLSSGSIAQEIAPANKAAIRSVSPRPRTQTEHPGSYYWIAKTAPNLNPSLSLNPSLNPQIHLITNDTEEERVQPFVPIVNQPDITFEDKLLASEVLRALPGECLPFLKRFVVRYDRPNQRGLAGKSSIVIDGSVEENEFRSLLVHEFGHVTDLGCLTGTSAMGASAFRDGNEIIWNDDPSVSFYAISWKSAKEKHPEARAEDFVSGYSASDAFEDFAETYAFFLLQRESFVQRAQSNRALAMKLRWMEDHIPARTIASGSFRWRGDIPWDVTKLPYVWLGSNVLAQQ